MIICCIGDSLTEGDHGVKGRRGIPNVSPINYPSILAQMTGAEVRNYGKCGWRSSDMLRWYAAGGIDLHGTDVVILMLGTNGGQSAKGTSAEDRAYKDLVKRIQHDVPGSRLFLCTPPNATVNPIYSNCGYAPQVAEAVAFVRKYAAERKLPVIDLAASSKITPEAESVLQSNDGLHFTDEGYKVLAEEILSGLNVEGQTIMKHEKSCGAVVYTMREGIPFFLVEHMTLGHTSLPKGHVEGNETEEQTAAREIKEETNLEVRMDTNFRHEISYSPYPGIMKTVVFFIAQASTFDLVNQESEVSSLEWMDYERAYNAMTYDTDKEVLEHAKQYLA